MDKRPFRTTRKLANLQDGWYRIRNKTAAATRIDIYDEIGYVGITADSFVRDLGGIDGDIELHVNSPGGDVFGAITMFNNLKQRDGTVSVIVDGLAASAASFVAQAASPGHLAMAPHSQMMIHDGFGAAIGNAADMRQMADLLDKASDNIARVYADRSGKSAGFWREQMRAETWFDDAEAVTAGLADKVLGQDVSNSWDLSVYRGPQRVENAKYNADDRKRMASSGEAMPDGSYPIADAEDLDNAIHAVGRGGADHDAIRRHIIKRASALKLSSRIPDNWGSDGSISSSSNSADANWLIDALKGASA